MNRNDLILAVLAASNSALFTPAQIQKLLFLIDKKIPGAVGGPHFNFEAYDYGPFDKEIYAELGDLSDEGMVEIITEPYNIRRYRTTPEGKEKGDAVLATLAGETVDYLKQLIAFIRSLSFPELISAIYKEFPEMKVNSVFRE